MKFNIKQIISASIFMTVSIGFVSCDSFLDRKPITDVTNDVYYGTADQLNTYTIGGYNNLKNSRGQHLYHVANWTAGVTLNDNQTDNYIREGGSIEYFANNKQIPQDQTVGYFAGEIRVWNTFLTNALGNFKQDKIKGDRDEIRHQIGEGYFFRAFTYYRALVAYGDFPIVKVVLKNDKEDLLQYSKRYPRNEVARFILSDLDEAISLLKDKGYKNNLRINKQAALLFKSRVALFEGTFEKYHRGTGRVPGDANWPGKDKDYNKGKTFDIDAEISFFLEQAMDAAKKSVEGSTLTDNSHQINPNAVGQISGWNPYFEMFSSVDLSSNSEVLLWRQYNSGLSVTHDASYILTPGGDRSGITLSFVNSFLMNNGLPIYASGSNYEGDETLEKQQNNRDERLQLFVFKESDASRVDPRDPVVKEANKVCTLDSLNIIALQELVDMTGFRPRKYVSYDYDQLIGNQNVCYTGCPIFRISESYLNYIEACYEKTGSIDATASEYWKALRRRAGVDEDFQKTINNTDLDREANVADIDGVATIQGDLAVYSGTNKIDATLYNIRRERRCEFISEGMRWDDLKRWRSWDVLVDMYKYQVMGINLWDDIYRNYPNLVDSGDGKNISSRTLSKYILPLTIKTDNNPLIHGYSWKKAYYLEPLGVKDFTITSTKDGDINTTVSYQNPYWPMTSGKALE